MSAMVGGAGIAGLSKETTAAKIAADSGGSIEDEPWEDFESYTNDQYGGTTSSINPEEIAGPGSFVIPNPVSLGFDVCATEPDGDQLCVSTFTLGEEMYESCAGRTLAKFGFDMVEKTLLNGGDYEVDWSLKCWVGFDSADCVWVGIGNELDECSRVMCPDYPDYDPTIAQVEDLVWDISQTVVEKIRDLSGGFPAAGSQANIAAIAVVGAVLYIAILAPPPGVPG